MGQQRVDFFDDSFPLEKWGLFLKRFVPEQHGKRIEAKQVLERVDVAAVFPKQRDQLTEIVSERILDAATRTPCLKGLLSRLLCVEPKKISSANTSGSAIPVRARASFHAISRRA